MNLRSGKGTLISEITVSVQTGLSVLAVSPPPMGRLMSGLPSAINFAESTNVPIAKSLPCRAIIASATSAIWMKKASFDLSSSLNADCWGVPRPDFAMFSAASIPVLLITHVPNVGVHWPTARFQIPVMMR
jgi:hypothetical protein